MKILWVVNTGIFYATKIDKPCLIEIELRTDIKCGAQEKPCTSNQEAGTLFQGTQRMPSAQNKTPWKSQLGFTSSPLETSAAKRQM